ncbi:hypothetical protein O7A70_19525 [Mesorhizobium sp. Cs1299R1N1]|uniref:hypothetical protein n=1 Tax=unclassified Mesorhizobium TaxID=325217 RepID=UPI0004B5CA8B|nr:MULTISPECIES: hypothetical protein [unclassified Mesorhizobium]
MVVIIGVSRTITVPKVDQSSPALNTRMSADRPINVLSDAINSRPVDWIILADC